MQFRTCKNFWDSAGLYLAFIPKILTNTKAIPPLLRLRFCESQNLGVNQIKIAESVLDSADSQNLDKNNPSLRDSAKQNCGKPPIEKTQDLQGGLPREQSSLAMTKNNNFAESALDSAPFKAII